MTKTCPITRKLCTEEDCGFWFDYYPLNKLQGKPASGACALVAIAHNIPDPEL